MRIAVKLIIGSLFIIVLGCKQKTEKKTIKSDLHKDVELTTDYGKIILRLSDETPIHRNNFIELVNKKSFDNLTFHRVINNFLIQTGDMNTRLPKSTSDHPEKTYTIDAEINLDLMHKRGAINAARMGDDYNPTRASDGTQFTIIQGKIHNDSTLAISEKRINDWLAYNKAIHLPEYKLEYAKLYKLSNTMEDFELSGKALDSISKKVMLDSINTLRQKFDSLAKIELTKMKPYKIPNKHREIYKTIGGAPHLDQNYTVFGEVIKGMSIVDSIAAVKTNNQGNPINDVRILSAKMIDRR